MKAVLVCVIAAVLLQGYTVHGQREVLMLSSTGEAFESTGPWILTIGTANGDPASADIRVLLEVILPVNGGGIIPQDEVTRTVILTDGTSSVNQSYTPSDNIIIDIDGERRFVVEATILDSGLADFMVSGNPNDLQNRDSAILTVLDDDVVIVEFTEPTFTGSEDSQSAIVSLQLAAGSAIVPAAGLTVSLTASPGPPGPGGASVADYDPDSASVFFAAGQVPGAIQSFSFDVTDDSLVESLESFLVEGDVSAAAFAARFSNGLSTDTVTVNIVDNDAVIVEFTEPTFTGSEDTQSATVSLRLAAGSATVPAAGLTVSLTASPGSASAADYDPDSGSVTFTAGQGPGAIQSFSFDINDDSLVESLESFSVEGSVSTPARFSNGLLTDTVTVNIVDNDVVRVEFTANSYDGFEQTQTAIVTLRLAATSAVVPAGGFIVQLSSAPGSATAPADYTAIPAPNPVQFFAGDGPLTQRSTTFTIIDDSIVEPLESFSVTGSVTAPVIFLNPDTVNVNIVDNDVVTVAFVPAAYNVREDQGPVSVCLRIIDGSLAPGVTATVSIDSADGSATQPNDYPQVVSRVITFTLPGGIEECTPIAVVDDGIDDALDTENFFLDLTPGANSAIGNPDRATVNIIDIHLFCSFSTDNYGVDEGDTVTLMVTLQGQPPSVNVDKFINCQGVTATAGVDFTPPNQVITFPVGSTAQPVPIDTSEDGLKEDDETFTCTLSDSPNPPVVAIGSPSTATITIRDDDDCTIGLITGPPPPTVPIAGATDCYIVSEHLGPATAYVGIISGSIQGGRQITVNLSTSGDTATGGVDFINVVETLTFSSSVTYRAVDIPIRDDLDCEVDETIIIELTTLDNDVTLDPRVGCVTIEDDEDCCQYNPLHPVCDVTERCIEFIRPNNFTCECIPPYIDLPLDNGSICIMPPTVGDDPHFSIGLSDGKMLCYTVQGEHGFAFNLISNEKVYMNAKFVPDSRRDEVTWLGSMGIVVQSNGYKKANATAMRFEAIENKIYINDKIELRARNIDKLTFEDGKLMISEAPPVEGFKYPRVLVDLKDVELSFSVAFMNEHLDLYWHSTGQQTADSHGLIGQFFRKGIELDEVRKILILAGKEPVPVMRRPVWSFMERETPDDQLCWTAMNPGYQGEGLIDGTYYDYVVNDVLSTKFKFKKQK